MHDYERLKTLLSETNGAVIGYSGGVDSTLVAAAANDALGDRAVCVLVDSCLVPEADVRDAIEVASNLGLNLTVIDAQPLEVEGVADNSPDRCYHCKKAVFSEMVRIAREKGLSCVLDGSNADDESDFRPGSRATAELAVRSPLKELGLTKQQVREMSRERGLPTWNKPSYACLASRIPYGTPLTPQVLKQVESAEMLLRELGFGQFRVRHHGDVARIELLPSDMDRLLYPATRAKVAARLKALGYQYVALDLVGYRTGSMNESLETARKV